MPVLPAEVYVPIGAALVAALAAVWAAWKAERSYRAIDNKGHVDRYERLVRDVLEQGHS